MTGINTFFRWLRYTSSGKWLFFLAITLSVSISILFLQPGSLTGSSSKSIFIVGLVNFNLVLLVALAFVVCRNLFRLIFDRKNKVIGTGIRKRLVFAFVTLTILPTSIMFLLASGLIHSASTGWFNSQVESLVESAIDVSGLYFEQERAKLNSEARQVKNLIENNPVISADEKTLSRFLSDLRNKYALSSIAIFSSDGKEQISEHSVVNRIEDLAEPAVSLPEDFSSSSIVMIEKKGTQYIRFFSEILYNSQKHRIVITRRISPEISAQINNLQAGYREYGQLKYFKTPLTASYLLTLALISGVILFAAIWFGFYLAREISEPLRNIAFGTKEVARGNYDVQVEARGDDELTELADSFNQMVVDIKTSRFETEQRRQYTETILYNLPVGVIGLNTDKKVVAVNNAAEEIFGVSKEYLSGLSYEQLFRRSEWKALHQFVLSSLLSPQQPLEQEVNIKVNALAKKLIVTIVNVHGSGIVLLFDDITDLAKAQQVAAWREVARRLAHEIKNPLTPIKLSAQRIIKKVDSANREMLLKAGHTIVDNVDTIKVLIDEFVQFARLPGSEMGDVALNELLQSVVDSYASKYEQIKLNFVPDNSIKEIAIDKTQFRRCMINLIENAVAAIQEAEINQGQVEIRTLRLSSELINIEVSDNGTGLSDDIRPRIFDPYFTTKESGTGLGLAIVASIVADHQGKIRVYDREEGGSRFVIELRMG